MRYCVAVVASRRKRTAPSPRLFVSWDRLGLRALDGHLRGRALLIVTADDQNRTDMDALAAALRKNGSTALQHAAVETDHTFSGRRIALQTIVLEWLESLPATREGRRTERADRVSGSGRAWRGRGLRNPLHVSEVASPTFPRCGREEVPLGVSNPWSAVH